MSRRGVTLLVVLLGLLVLGGAATVLASMGASRWHEGTRVVRGTRALLAAEGESERKLARWEPGSLAVGASAVLNAGPVAGSVEIRDTLTRLGPDLYLLHVVAEDNPTGGTPLARDGVARVVAVQAPLFPDSQAVMALGPASLEDRAVVDGSDYTPDGWAPRCSAPDAPAPGIRAGPATPVADACSAGTCITGSPPLLRDSTVGPNSLLRLGAMTVADLLASADLRTGGLIAGPAPRITDGVCDRDDPANWGGPGGNGLPCSGYFPIILAAPGTRVIAGTGQGVLIGLGQLELSGDFSFGGVILALGPIHLAGQSRVSGLVFATDGLVMDGDARVEFSRCAASLAMGGAHRPRRRADRSWVRLPH